MVKVGKGWVKQEFVLLNHCSFAKWNRVAKWVNILQDIGILLFGKMELEYHIKIPSILSHKK
jgi:hypothetical protein